MKAKQIDVILVGAKGNMGRELIAMLADHTKASFLTGVDSGGGQELRSFADLQPTIRSVVIDFSRPEGFRKALDWCVRNKVPFVSGTTGLSAKDEQALTRAGKKIPVLWAPNMSIGVQIYLKMLKAVAKDLEMFDLQIEEIHHRKKVDAPSGTAKWIQATVEKSSGRKLPPVVSIRGGGVFGVHSTYLMAGEETITLTHTALNRRLFARGAVEAAIWLKRKRPGRYHLADMFGG